MLAVLSFLMVLAAAVLTVGRHLPAVVCGFLADCCDHFRTDGNAAILLPLSAPTRKIREFRIPPSGWHTALSPSLRL